jgi:hypothetical protein
MLHTIKKPKEYREKLGKQDLIYSIGLADYLPDRVLGRLLSFLISLLVDGGRLVIAHKDISAYKPLPPNWFCDWNFYSRGKAYLFNLIKKHISVAKFDLQTEYDRTGLILFLSFIKKG